MVLLGLVIRIFIWKICDFWIFTHSEFSLSFPHYHTNGLAQLALLVLQSSIILPITTRLNSFTQILAFLLSRCDTKWFCFNQYEIGCLKKKRIVLLNFFLFALYCRPVTESHFWEDLYVNHWTSNDVQVYLFRSGFIGFVLHFVIFCF